MRAKLLAMKLLMVARRYPPDIRSGTETVFANLYTQARQRHDLSLVVGFKRDRSLVPEEALAVDLRHGSRWSNYLKLRRSATAAIRRFRPDAVLSNSIEVPLTGTPTVCIVHDVNFGKSEKNLGTWARLLYYLLKSRRIHRIITVSEAMKYQLSGMGLPRSRITAIRNGVDLERFHPPQARRNDGRITIAYPSRIIPGKGQHIAIDAISRMPASVKARIRLQIVGTVADPSYARQLDVQAREQPVSFHYEVPDIARYYRESDIVIFPTLMSEGFGYTAVEAMACARPVIWSDQPAIREATGGIGMPVSGGDPADWMKAMLDLIDNPTRRERIGQNGRAFVEGHYRWNDVWTAYEHVLSTVAGGMGSGGDLAANPT